MQTRANTTDACSRHTRSRQRPPRYLYTTPFAWMALLMACLMAIPIPRLAPIPQARADDANGTCELICTKIDPPICTTSPDGSVVICQDLSCHLDPPDCQLSPTSFCYCNDR